MSEQPEQPNGTAASTVPKRKWTKLTDSEWHRIRHEYETDPRRPTHTELGHRNGVSESTVWKRATAENWQRQDTLAIQAVRKVKEQNNLIVAEVAETVSKQLGQQLTDSLQPWLEREKTRHIRAQVKRSKIALKQLDTHISPTVELDPKESAFIAKSADTWDNIARRNLGLNDNNLAQGSLTLNVLANHAAVQVKSES